jgi:ferredoxin-NADP reductase
VPHTTRLRWRNSIPSPSDADAYLAGPSAMVREVVKVLNAKGIGKDRIHYDEIAVR